MTTHTPLYSVCHIISEVSCGPPEQAANAILHGDIFLLGHEVSYSCLEGYNFLSGDLSRVCKANGEWSGTTPKCGM